MLKIPTEQAPAGAWLDAAVAEAMGLQAERPAPYSYNYNIASWIQGWVRDESKRFAYLCHLIDLIGLDVTLFDGALERDSPMMDVPEAIWALVHATPEQRCKAFLLANGVRFVEVGDG